MTMPAPEVWETAEDAYEAAEQHRPALPDPVRRALDALSTLLAVYDGYGED
jgi:hypothetical protein